MRGFKVYQKIFYPMSSGATPFCAWARKGLTSSEEIESLGENAQSINL